MPFRFPATPDIGGGLTTHGMELIKRCNNMGIMIDLAHLNQAGFDDIAGLPVLIDAMERHGYGDQLVQKICHGNWFDVLQRTWRDQ